MFNRSVILQTMLSLVQMDIKPQLEYRNTHNAPVTPAAPVCYGAYGCFSLDAPWLGDERPVAVAPWPPYELELELCLHTQQQPDCHVLDVENFSTIRNSTLNTSSHLYVITHGFIESRNISWMSDMTEVLLDSQQKPCVISVGWSKAANPPYTQAVANTRITGHIVGYLLHILVEYFDHKPSLINLVGHSLGSHLMGYAGSYFKEIQGQKVSRITGLDPAGPYFTNTPPEVHLDPTDAAYVEVIHTDETSLAIGLPFSLGLPAPIGHVDYYPNGGGSQMGCEGSMASKVDSEITFRNEIIKVINLCQKTESREYRRIKLNVNKCEHKGVACASWEDYLHGRCWGCHNSDTCYTFVQSKPFQKEAILPEGTQLLTTLKPAAGQGTTDNQINIEKALNATAVQNDTHISTQQLPVHVKVFFGTNSLPPFCGEQYLVTAVSSSSVASMESGGAWARLNIMLFGTLSNVHINPPDKPDWLSAGGVAQWVGFGRPLGELRHARVTYHEEPGFLGLFIPRLTYDSLFLEKISIEELTTGRRIDLFVCSEEIKAGNLQVLYHNRTC
ncbi:unnamed protein product, partial [Meganyctiphanes norvegica]